jgi:uncharacterized protein (TIGR02246 family)
MSPYPARSEHGAMPATASPSGLPHSRPTDEEHIVRTLLTVATAFATLDAAALRTAYAADADWIGTDGTELHGRNAIIDHLRRLFAASQPPTGSLVHPPTLSLRWLDDDAVIATTYLERRSQRTIDGRTLPRRGTHSLKVLTRSEHDRWLIVADIYADAHRDDGR